MTTRLTQFGLVVISAGLLAGVPPRASADVIIDTTPLWNGSNGISSFGLPNTATYGETVTAPAAPDDLLDSFSFLVREDYGTVAFRGYVYAWDGAKATGPALFVSPTQTLTPGASFQSVTFTTGGVPLTPGARYVLFASPSGVPGSDPSTGSEWAYLGTSTFAGQDGYAGGNFVFLNNGNDPAQWTTTAWNDPTYYGGRSGDDLAFRVSFAAPPPPPPPVPEPSTLALLALGGGALAGWRRWRKRRA
jgi:hypothetical protein